MGSGVVGPTFLTSAFDGGEWSASRPGPFTLGEISPNAHWIEGWVGPRAGLDVVEKGKIFSMPGFTPWPVACCYTD
jgi:hypothetical protein